MTCLFFIAFGASSCSFFGFPQIHAPREEFYLSSKWVILSFQVFRYILWKASLLKVQRFLLTIPVYFSFTTLPFVCLKSYFSFPKKYYAFFSNRQVANTEAVRDFLKAPTLDKLKKIPTKHRSFLIAESLKVDAQSSSFIYRIRMKCTTSNMRRFFAPLSSLKKVRSRF